MDRTVYVAQYSENALLCFCNDAFNIYYIVDIDEPTSPVRRERIFAFP